VLPPCTLTVRAPVLCNLIRSAPAVQPEALRYRRLWEQAVDDALATMSGHSVPGGLAFIGEKSGGGHDVRPRMEHLACFFPGNMALGVYFGAVSGAKAERYLEWAHNLTHSCYQMYAMMPSGAHGATGSTAGGHRKA
jgi:Glycosyl hydrolase family 47